MRHQVKKIKIKFGKDANKMLFKKLLKNFLKTGKLETTLTKAKILKSFIDKLIYRLREDKKLNRQYVRKHVGDDKRILNFLFKNVGEVFKDVVGGYVKIKKLHQRSSDGSLMAQLVWSRPVIIETTDKKKKKEKNISEK